MAIAKKYAYNGKMSDKKFASLKGQYKIVMTDMMANTEPRLISEVTESCGHLIVTRQSVERVVGYYIIVAKSKGFVDAFLNEENEIENDDEIVDNEIVSE
jgi:MinD-like ATPase involved in chromosome partitioning or flagellar assembly